MVNTPQNRTTIPAIGEGKRGEQGHIGYLLRQAASVHRLRMERALADLAITTPQFSVLTMLAAYPNASGADLARLSLLTPQTMSVIVSNLERRNAVSRRPHPIHGRIQHIEITELGLELLNQCRQRANDAEEALLVDTNPDEEQVIRHWLVKVALHGTAES